MKKCRLKTLGLSLFALASQVAFAAEKQSPFTSEQMQYLKNEFAKKEASENIVSFYGLIQINANTSDTQRSNVPDFSGQHVRLGTKINSAKASGQVEVELLGNQPSGASSSVDPITGTTITSTPADSGILIRQAQLNFDVLNLANENSSFLTTLSLGGVRIGGAAFTTPDIANAPSQYSRQDGLYVQEKMAFNKTFNVNVGLGVFNSLFGISPGNKKYAGWPNNTTYITRPSPWAGTSLNKSLAYVGTFNTTYNLDASKSFNAIFYYGVQKNSPALMNGDGSVVTTRDTNHTEASLFYNDTKIFGAKGVISANGLSAWYEQEANGRSNNASTSAIGMVDDSQVATLYGVGAAADSANYLSNMVTKNDRLTYAAAYSVVTNSFGNTNTQSYTVGSSTTAYTNQAYKVNQISGSFGYAVSSFELALNGEYSKSDTNIFIDSNNKPQNSEAKTYVTAAVVF